MTALEMTAPAPEPGQLPPLEPRLRGVLVIRDRAAQRLVEAILRRECPGVIDSSARVRQVDNRLLEIGATVTLRYPTASLSDALAAVRTRLADEATRQLGRGVRRLDLTVDELVVNPPPARRVG